MKPTAIDLVSELMRKINEIKLNDATTILGGSSASGILNELRRSAANLSEALNEKQSYKDVMQRYEALAGSIDTAGVTGLISESEMPEYYRIIDSAWAAIERDEDPPN